MSAWRVEWARLVDRRLAGEIARAVGSNAALSAADVREPVARILSATGGWPYVDRLPTAARARAHVRALLAEALARALGGRGEGAPGYRLVEAGRGTVRVEPAERAEVNVASADQLRTALGLSARLAAAIIEERERRGAFRGLDDLVDRVDGLGPRRGAALAPRLGFRRAPAPAPAASGDWRRDLAALAAQEPGGDPRARAVAALARAARLAEAERHPHLKHRRVRPFAAPAPPAWLAADACAVLAGRRYYGYVLGAIGRARERIDLAMYHIAMPGTDHPTRRLLDALARAHRRGVAVRVFVDRDRRADPYRSTVINAAAVQRLLAAGVRVRVDSARRLLHSKFLVVDDDLTVLGSHNWSAGSYFGFDDLSVAVRSAGLARPTRRRFDVLWRRGAAARRGRGTAPR